MPFIHEFLIQRILSLRAEVSSLSVLRQRVLLNMMSLDFTDVNDTIITNTKELIRKLSNQMIKYNRFKNKE